MSIQNLYGCQVAGGKLGLSWESLGSPIAISIQLASDMEFTVQTRTFILPKGIKRCELDAGAGKWFYRVGAWIGTATDGVIEWSGIYGPVGLQSNKQPPQVEPFPIVLTSVLPAYNAILLHTGIYEQYYMIIHVTQKDSFKASGMKTYYKQDWGAASVQVSGLDSQMTYSFQLQMIVGNKAVLPDDTIQMLTDVYTVKNKKTAMIVKPKTNTDHATYSADKAILQDSIGRRKQNFGSYAQYLQYLAAKARTTAPQNS